MPNILHTLFEEQLKFRQADGTEIDGSVFLGSTEFTPLEIINHESEVFNKEFGIWYNESWREEQFEIRQEILEIHSNKTRYADLKRLVEKSKVVPFVGSGLSAETGLPTWSDLLRTVAKYTRCDLAEINHILDEGRYEDAADKLASSANVRLFRERIEHELRINDDTTILGGIRFLPNIFSSVVITTNLDRILEAVYESADKKFEHKLSGLEIGQFRELRSDDDLILLKLHGDIIKTQTQVLTSAQYDHAYELSSTVRKELSLVYSNYSLLFLGCSLSNDRTIGLIEKIARTDENMPKHYCFAHHPKTDADWLEREHFLTERGIYPIWYKSSHDTSITALLDGLTDSHGLW